NQFAIRDYKEWMPWTTKESWDAENLIKMIRDIHPDIIINNRTGLPQDIDTPEQTATPDWPKNEAGERIVWEACHTFSGSWGYYRDEMSWKTPENLLRILVSCVSLGGNLIMNVGPTARGVFDHRADAALEVYGEWMKYNSRSIYGCTMAQPCFKAPMGSLLTQSQDGKRLYIHLIDYPYAELVMDGIADYADYAQFLHDGSEIRFRKNANGSVNFVIPGIKPKMLNPVIEVFLK
ncbi:MAG: alpha-L-fucosidase, partial [Clostridia bacterium]|nr:alpha-L-fucosidase [Clostridia bacterium]